MRKRMQVCIYPCDENNNNYSIKKDNIVTKLYKYNLYNPYNPYKYGMQQASSGH